MVRFANPFAFAPVPVTVLTTLIYSALLSALIVVHVRVPAAPDSATSISGINLTEAWRDLQLLTRFYHPYNSHRNDDIRNFLLARIDEILERNGASVRYPDELGFKRQSPSVSLNEADVFVFNDLVSNYTFTKPKLFDAGNVGEYFEGTNIIVYIRGTEDDSTEWWNDLHGSPSGPGGVLMNAHYDSVTTGYGATDDGVGVITLLQLIRYYSTRGQRPKRGFVALLNNGEEENLLGARAFGCHPLSRFTKKFLNVEGAGAGGRAHMFRATDAEVASAYRKAPRPFSSVIANDLFNMGFIKSQTDYIILHDVYGMRGLDLSFYEPRARYHTDQDDARHTSPDSLWHMLSASLATTRALTSDVSDKFDSDVAGAFRKNADQGHAGVWFDVFGWSFAVARLYTFFALSVTLLVAAPIILILHSIILYKVDKFYLLSGSWRYHDPSGDEEVKLYGWRGFFRFPALFVISSAVPVALAFLLTKQNPFIVHSSPWAVWAMMFSAWVFVSWFLCCSAYFTRPTALTRVYGYTWLLSISWLILVAVTVSERRLGLALGFWFNFYFGAVFVVTWLSHLELLALPKKSKYCHSKIDDFQSTEDRRAIAPDAGEQSPAANEHEEDGQEATESTSLLRRGRQTTFANYTRNDSDSDSDVARPSRDQQRERSTAYGDEQEWSSHLPQWIWVIQVILLVPIATVFCAQAGLLLISASYQTGPDGSSTLVPYIFQAVFTILILLPLIPILHRFTWHVPIFLLLVLIGTLIYNLIAFPFSSNNRMAVFFQQTVDLDTGANNVSLQSVQPYLIDTISTLPSSDGKQVSCDSVKGRGGVERCSWPGLPPQVVRLTRSDDPRTSVETRYRSWVSFNVTQPSPRNPSTANSARLHVRGKNTRACKITFERSITRFHVLGGRSLDEKITSRAEGGITEIKLWSRNWAKSWDVDVEWDDSERESFEKRSRGSGSDDGFRRTRSGIAGKVSCQWSDGNELGVIPAFDEVRRFAPTWTAVRSIQGGLVEGYKRFQT